MGENKWGVHEGHCCALHGCKYGDEDCPVTNGQTKQKYVCGHCTYDGFEKVEHIDEYLRYHKEIKKAKENGCNTIMVNVDFLHRMFNLE